MDGDYEVDDLGALLAVATANANNIEVRAWLGGCVAVALLVLVARLHLRKNKRGYLRASVFVPLSVCFSLCLHAHAWPPRGLAMPRAPRLFPQESRGLLGVFNWLGDRLLAMAHAARSNTLEGSRRNIEEHYDAGEAGWRGNRLAGWAGWAPQRRPCRSAGRAPAQERSGRCTGAARAGRAGVHGACAEQSSAASVVDRPPQATTCTSCSSTLP